MRLWIINHYASQPNKPGGTRHYSISKNLKPFGIETTIIHANYSHLDSCNNSEEIRNNHFNNQSVKMQNFDGIKFISIPTPMYRGNASLGRIFNMICFGRKAHDELSKGIYGKPDFIIGSTMTLFAANTARILANAFNVPFVYEVRDLWPLTPIELGGYSRWHPFLLYLDYLDRKLAKSADLIITTAPLMKEYYKERFGIPDEKFLWITNGTDLELFKNLPVADENEKKDTFDIYYAGAHGLANGLDQIFDQLPVIMAKHPQVRLTLVGDGPLKKHLKERAEKKNLPVRFLDAVPKNELPAILNKADALLAYLEPCSLYRYGISPNKLADYHAIGRPILFIGDCAENPVLHSGAGIVAKDVTELPVVLSELVQMDRDKKAQMGINGRLYAEKSYDWAKLAELIASNLSRMK